ncbi:MAG: Ubiquitin-like protein [Phylliscum demangeonii]|nr:MAG: Ubiquitin-like protein [Phylliscum demangeonii]
MAHRPSLHPPRPSSDSILADGSADADADADDDTGPRLPLSASVVLSSLPRATQHALHQQQPAAQPPQKITVRFKAVGSAPILTKQVYKISAGQRFETVVKFLRSRLRCAETEAVFLYVNSVFAPGLDEGVGNLFECFKTDDQLIVAYSITPAFG